MKIILLPYPSRIPYRAHVNPQHITRGDESPAQYMEALRAGNESASADFHALRREFIPRRNPS